MKTFSTSRHTFADLEAPGRVVIEHASEPRYRLTISLAASPTGTLVSWSQAFERLEAIVVPANDQNLARLSAEVLGQGGQVPGKG